MAVAHPRYPHLPLGREPGPQSRSTRQSGHFRSTGFFLVAAFFIGCGVWLFANRNNDAWTGKPIAGVEAFLLGCALLMAGLGYLRLRRGRSRVPKHFAVAVDRVQSRRGEQLRATLTVRHAAKISGGLQVGLVAIERYDEDIPISSDGQGTQRETKEKEVFEHWVDADPRPSKQTISYTIPADGYCSYEGEHLSYGWRVEAREQRKGLPDRKSRAPIWVTP